MAISFIGTGTRAGFGTGTSVTGTEPTGSADGDLLVAWLIAAGSLTLASTGGFTGAVAQQVSVDSLFTARPWYLVRSGVPNLAFTWGGASVYRELVIATFRGVDTTTPINTSAVSTTGNRTTPNGPAVTPNVDNAMILSLIAQWFGAPSGGWTAPTNYTLCQTSAITEDSAMARRLLVGGSGASEDPGAFNVAGGSDDCWEVTLALTPSSGSTVNRIFFPMGMDAMGGGRVGGNRIH